MRGETSNEDSAALFCTSLSTGMKEEEKEGEGGGGGGGGGDARVSEEEMLQSPTQCNKIIA